MHKDQTQLVNADSVTRIMDDMLLHSSFNPQTPEQFFQSLALKVSTELGGWNEDAIMEHWSWPQRIGAVVLTGMQPGGVQPCPRGTRRVAGFYVTPGGRVLLEKGDRSVHNPSHYFAKIRDRVGSPDEVVMAYLEEGVAAWGAGLNRAAVVMVGCACERLILLLARSLSETNTPPWSQKLATDLKKTDRSPVSISTIFQRVREALLALAEEEKLPGKLADAIDLKVTPIFEHARALRNAGGHPTIAEISSDDAEGALLLFPGFYFLTDEIAKALGAMAK